MSANHFEHDPTGQQFRLTVDGQVAWVDYEIREGVMYLLHSEVPEALRGKSVGKMLVEQTFEYLKAHSQKAVAVCSYIRAVATRSATWRTIIQ
jgi:uncharacterized protein